MIVVGGELHASIKVPTDSDAQNFSLREPEKTSEGFKLTFDYGTRYHYDKEFDFICKEGKFYLYKMREESFDGFDAKSMNNPTVKEIKINPNLPIEKFSIFDYL